MKKTTKVWWIQEVREKLLNIQYLAKIDKIWKIEWNPKYRKEIEQIKHLEEIEDSNEKTEGRNVLNKIQLFFLEIQIIKNHKKMKNLKIQWNSKN